MTDKLRGHSIVYVGDKWFYKDTMEVTVGSERSCGYCGKNNMKNGHDGCLGTIPNVMNACCGHGAISEAYIQYYTGNIIRGEEAVKKFTV